MKKNNEDNRKQNRMRDQNPELYNSYAEQEYKRPKNRKPAIELPYDFYDNTMPRKRQLPSKDDIKSKQAKGKLTVYRNQKKKNIDKLRPAFKNKEYWQGV